jgi:hypothetical protein
MKTNKSSWAFAIPRRDFKQHHQGKYVPEKAFCRNVFGARLFVDDDGFSAEIDSRNLVFCDNAEGDIIGDVTDVAPSLQKR